MALLKEWHKIAYDEKKDKGTLQRFTLVRITSIWKKEFMRSFFLIRILK